MKEDSSIDPVSKRKESEYFHGKALEIACSFLPSECPLVNHILMSYQKHHAPSHQTIKETQECSEDLKIIRPLLGIESNKHQPIIRDNSHLKVFISPLPISLISYKSLLKNLKSPNLNHKKYQTAQSQTTTQYPSNSSGVSTNYMSIKNSKKAALAQTNPR